MTISRGFVERKEDNLSEPVNGRWGKKRREGRRKKILTE